MSQSLETIETNVYTGNKIITEKINNQDELKIITLMSTKKSLNNLCNCDRIIKYDVTFIEEFNDENGLYDKIVYCFEFIWNFKNNTYFLNDISNNNFETNIIGNICNRISTKEQNKYFLKGERFINYVLEKPLTFKKLVDDCF